MNGYSSQYTDKSTKATKTYNNVQSQLSREQQQSISPSNVSLFLPNASAREARSRLDSKKSFMDDHMFYPYKEELHGMADGISRLPFISPGPHIQGLAKYNEKVTQQSFKNSLERIKSTGGMNSPAVIDGYNFHLHNIVNHESKGNPYLMNFNSQHPVFPKDEHQFFPARSGKESNKW